MQSDQSAFYDHDIAPGGGGNAVKKNIIGDTGNTGIRVVSTGDLVTKNSILSSAGNGIDAYGTGNAIVGNVAIGGTPYGLRDAALRCANAWVSNVSTKNQRCVQ